MRQTHIAGEKMFVDFSGETIPIVDLKTGETHQVELFIAVLGASNYTYVEACRSQDLPSWIQAHCNAFEFFGGVPKILVPDNLKSGVKDPDYYEPDSNPTYLEMAQHYDMVIIPTRPYKSRDKAKAENSVLQAERRIIAALRNQIFTSLADLNAAIVELRERLNNKPFQKLEGSRRSLYEELDRPALNPLPNERYVFASWRKAIVNIDYHIEVEKAYYSVPYQLVREQVDVRLTANTVEVLHKGRRVASHPRARRKGYCSTNPDHSACGAPSSRGMVSLPPNQLGATGGHKPVRLSKLCWSRNGIRNKDIVPVWGSYGSARHTPKSASKLPALELSPIMRSLQERGLDSQERSGPNRCRVTRMRRHHPMKTFEVPPITPSRRESHVNPADP